MQRHITVTGSYGERSVFLLPLPLAVFIGILLLLEPIALYWRIGYENYRSTGMLRIPLLYLLISSIIRVFIRIVITIAVLESCSIAVDNGSIWAYVFLTYFFLAEVFLGFVVNNKKEDRLVIKPNMLFEIAAQLICLILLALIAAYFEKTFVKELLVDSGWSTPAKILVAALLFILLYIPSRIIDFYIGWIQQKSLQQKLLYIAGIAACFAAIAAYALNGRSSL